MRPHWISGGIFKRLARLSFKKFLFAVASPVFATRLYRKTLGAGGAATANAQAISFDRWPGDAGRGATIIDGDFELTGKTVLDTDSPWREQGASARWRARTARFDWLSDLQAAGGENARVRARRLIRKWIETDGDWNRIGWQAEVLGGRISNWLIHSDFLLSGADDAFRDAFFASLSRQARHLSRIASSAGSGAGRILVIKGLVLSDLALNAGKRRVKLMNRLDREIERELMPDGGHLERNPSRHLSLLRDLLDIRTAITGTGGTHSSTLQNAIDRMTPMLRFFRHGDGMLGLFNGSIEEEDWLIDVVLERADARGKPLASAPYSGYERLTANRTLLLMDVGGPPPPGPDVDAHAGTLSFEFSVGKERVIVNCGAHLGDSNEWRTAQRTTAAHSTLSVENINSAEILARGGFGNRPETVTVERMEQDGKIWIDASHDGYRPTFGLTHQRRLHLDATGTTLRGEDTLTGRGGRKFAARFHLHPGVSASLVQDGNAVLLRLPSGAGWRFRARGGVLGLQESVYLGAGDRIKRAQQIVVAGATAEGAAQIKWMLSRI